MISLETTRTYALLLGASGGLGQELASEIAFLHEVDPVNEIHISVPDQDVEAVAALVGDNPWQKVAAVTPSRETRDATIFEALTVMNRTARDEDLVLIADAGQRSLTELTVSSCLAVAAEQGAALLASRVTGDVIHADESCKIHWLPPKGSTYVADGLLAAQFSRLFDLYEWGSTVAAGAVNEPYRWSVARLGAFVVPSNDLREPDPASEPLAGLREQDAERPLS